MSARGIGQAFLDHHLDVHPVDASFMGLRSHDHMLPRADRHAATDERSAIRALSRLVASAEGISVAERLDRRIAEGELACAEAALDSRPRWAKPAWFTGEAAFSVISLLLPQATASGADGVGHRLAAMPDFLADGRARLRDAGAAPSGWVARARREAAATAGFLTGAVRLHSAWRQDWAAPADAAALALAEFALEIERLPDCNPACGSAFLALIMARLHGLKGGPEALAQAAQAAFDRLGEELEEDAARLQPGATSADILNRLTLLHPAAEAVPGRYRYWHEAAVEAAAGLLTPETGYALDYRDLAAPFREVAGALYFLFYRSPPPLDAGLGSVYWLSPPSGDPVAYLRGQNEATIKLIHAVHHGSIGHHTHNARARVAASLLGRVAGTDCASGIALLSGGMAVEGWACYAEDLLMESDGFYSPGEILLLKQYERRNAASVLVDVNLHCGIWSLAEAMRFYRDEAGFAPSRVESEVVRNSMFPGSRLMYWAGVEAIRALRRRWRGGTRDFHDTLLGFGHVPMDAIETEMAREAQIG
jgi:hypothetical protein